MRFQIVLILLALSGCAERQSTPYYEAGRDRPQVAAPLPTLAGYGSGVGKQDIPWTNAQLAEDFLELAFETEWGAELPVLLRWERPVTVVLADEEFAPYREDARALVEELKAAAPGLSLSLGEGPRGDITFRIAPRDEYEALIGDNVCFFIPGSIRWRSYRQAPDSPAWDWERSRALTQVTVFVPAYSSPLAFRACLVEELSQALGLGNDVHRLGDSIFNDDSVNEYLTAFDRLMLAALYSPELRAGMTREQAAPAVAAAFERLREGGQRTRPRNPSVDAAYRDAVRRYYFSESSEEREALAETRKAVEAFSKDDHRRAETFRRLAHDMKDRDLKGALAEAKAAFEIAERSEPEGAARRALLQSDYGWLLLFSGDAEAALGHLEQAEPGLAAHRIDDELAYNIRLRSLALREMGREAEARRAEAQALEWAAYAFGGDGETLSNWRKEFKRQGQS